MYATLFDPRRVAAKKEAEHAKKEACSRLKLWALELVPAGLRLRVTVDEVAHEAGEGQVDTAVEFWGLDNELRNGVAIEAPAVDVSRDELEKTVPERGRAPRLGGRRRRRVAAAGAAARPRPALRRRGDGRGLARGPLAQVRGRRALAPVQGLAARDAYVPYALKLFRTGRATYAPTESHVRGNALDPEWKQRCPKQPKKERKKEKPLEGRALEEKEREEEREKEVVHKREGNVIDMTTGYDVSRKWRENARNRDHKPWRDKWKTDGNVIDFTDAGPRRSRVLDGRPERRSPSGSPGRRWRPGDRRGPSPPPRRARATAPSWRFGAGDRVVCNVGDGWQPGAVEYRDEPDPESPYFRLLPYVVRLDGSDRLIIAPRDGNDAIVAEACFGPRSETAWLSPLCGGFDAPGLAPLRFEVGDAVEALVEHRLGEETEWVAGAVAKVWPRVRGRYAPYTISLPGRLAGRAVSVVVHRDDAKLLRPGPGTAPKDAEVADRRARAAAPLALATTTTTTTRRRARSTTSATATSST
ncbi:hypothetical protein JL720_13090 [Aureococcus anophagefferens]|nr:hypothetical protein JL720_13090 [Aureococcus anophagefferens]